MLLLFLQTQIISLVTNKCANIVKAQKIKSCCLEDCLFHEFGLFVG